MMNNEITKHCNTNDNYIINTSGYYRLRNSDNNIDSNKKKLSIGKER